MLVIEQNAHLVASVREALSADDFLAKRMLALHAVKLAAQCGLRRFATRLVLRQIVVAMTVRPYVRPPACASRFSGGAASKSTRSARPLPR